MGILYLTEGLVNAARESFDEWLLSKMDESKFKGKVIKHYMMAKYSPKPTKTETLKSKIKEKKLQNELDHLTYGNTKRITIIEACEDFCNSMRDFIGTPKR